MDPQPDLNTVSTLKLRGELKRKEKRRDDLLADFPYLGDGSASLTAQYTGGEEWDLFAETESRINKLKLELIKRDRRAAKLRPSASGKAPMEGLTLTRRTVDPEVAKRRSLVKSNLGIPAQEMCQIFERSNVPLPSKWLQAGLRSWTAAYLKLEYRSRIDVLISKDKRDN